MFMFTDASKEYSIKAGTGVICLLLIVAVIAVNSTFMIRSIVRGGDEIK
jgi:hypothetical protein